MRRFVGVLLVVASLWGTRSVHAQSDDVGEWLMPDAGRASLSFATGVPYLAIQEAAFGFSGGFAVGVLAGVTPKGAGFGFRPRGAVDFSDTTRMLLVAPVFYYPSTMESMDWFLARPTLMLEQRFGSVRVSALAAAILTTCGEKILGHRGEEHVGLAEMGGRWANLGLGVALPVGDRSAVFLETSVAFDDDGLSHRVMAPFLVVLGASHRL